MNNVEVISVKVKQGEMALVGPDGFPADEFAFTSSTKGGVEADIQALIDSAKQDAEIVYVTIRDASETSVVNKRKVYTAYASVTSYKDGKYTNHKPANHNNDENIVVDYTDRGLNPLQRELRDLLGKFAGQTNTSEVRDQIVVEMWNFATKHNLNFQAQKPDEMELFPEQALALDNILASWKAKRPVILRVGMRGGKTVVSRVLVKRLVDANPNQNIVIVAPTIEQAMHSFADMSGYLTFKSYHTLMTNLTSMNNEDKTYLQDAVFIMDHAFWDSIANRVATLIRMRTPKILITSSEGPYHIDLDDALFIRAATWDWNLAVKPEDFESHFTTDFQKAARDFGLQDSRNILVAQTIRERFA